MIGGPRVTAQAYRGALRSRPQAGLIFHGMALDAAIPSFLCPAIESSLARTAVTSTPGPSSAPKGLVCSHRTETKIIATTDQQQAGCPSHNSFGLCRSYSTHASAATPTNDADSSTSRNDAPQLIWHQNQFAVRKRQIPHQDQPQYRSRSSPPISNDWRRKFPRTQWRIEMDFNRYSPPIRRRQLPEDAPALYKDEIRESLAWLPDSKLTLTVPDDYPLQHELFLILDSLDDISQSDSDPDRSEMLMEALRQARELIWANPRHPLIRSEDREAALYLAGKVAQTYVRLDAADSVDRLMAFLDFVHEEIGVLPMACFHAIAAGLGIARRYAAILRICDIAELHHGGKADAELLHLRLRALIAQSPNVDVTRYWDSFSQAGVPVPRKTFDLLLRTHVRRQDVSQVNEVLEAMIQHGHKVDAQVWLTILRGFQSFRPTLAAMLKRDAKIIQSPTLHVVNQLLIMLSDELDLDGVLMVLRIFRIPSIDKFTLSDSIQGEADRVMIINGPSPRPNAHTYAILVRMFGRLGRHEEALAFFRLALTTVEGPDLNVWNEKSLQQASAGVMRAYLNAGHPVLAMAFATHVLKVPYFGSAETKTYPMIDLGIPTAAGITISATSLHYRILLECFSALLSADGARRLIVYLLEQGHPIDRQILGGLSRLIFSTIDADALESIRVLRRLLLDNNNGSSERNQRLQDLSDSLRRLGAPERILLASRHSTDSERNIPHSDQGDSKGSATNQANTKIGNRRSTTKDELRDWLIKDSSSMLVGLPIQHTDSSDASALDHDLSQPLSPEAYALRMRVYAVVRRDYEAAQKVYHAMLKHGVRPTMMHVAPLIEGLTAAGKLDEAQQLKRNAKEVTGFQPTLRIHTALIRGYVRAGNSAAARREIRELTENGHEIDETISNIIEAAQSGQHNFSLVDRPIDRKNSHSVATRFLTLTRMRRYLAAQELLRSALDSGMKVDKVLHDLVRRSVNYVQKLQTKAKESEQRWELEQAERLGKENKERVTQMMNKGSETWRKKIKEHRKKVVKLVFDFADGKLDEMARKKMESKTGDQ